MKELTVKLPPTRESQLTILQQELQRHRWDASIDLLYFIWLKISEEYWAMSWNTITEQTAQQNWDLVVRECLEENQ